MYSVVYDTIEQLGPKRMAGLEGSRLDFSYGLLRALERSLWGDLEVRYLAVEEMGKVVAFTPVYLGTNLNVNALMPRFIQRAYAAMLDALGVGAAYRVAVVGCLISDRGWIPMLPDCNRRGVIDLLARQIDEVARADAARLCIIKDLHEEFDGRERLLAHGYTQTYSLPTIQVPTGFGSFDEYLAALTKNGRKHCRKTYRRAEGKLSLRAVTDFAPLVPQVYPLFRNTYLKARYQVEELSPEFFSACAGSEHPRTEMVLCEKGDRLVGSMLVFYDSREQLSKRIGLDYADEETALVYNLLMYEGLRRAVGRGLQTVWLGQSTYTPKTRMGGRMEEQYLFIKGYTPDIRASLPAQRLWLNRYRAERVTATLQEGNQE